MCVYACAFVFARLRDSSIAFPLPLSIWGDPPSLAQFFLVRDWLNFFSLWSRTTKNRGVGTGPLVRTAHSFACSILVAWLTCSALLIRSLTRSIIHSRTQWEVNQAVLNHSAFISDWLISLIARFSLDYKSRGKKKEIFSGIDFINNAEHHLNPRLFPSLASRFGHCCVLWKKQFKSQFSHCIFCMEIEWLSWLVVFFPWDKIACNIPE